MLRRAFLVGGTAGLVASTSGASAQIGPPGVADHLSATPRARLHPPISTSRVLPAESVAQLAALTLDRFALTTAMGGPAASVGSVSIPISTVSASGNFDALIDVIVAGLAPVPTCFDTGNSCLVLPYFEKISSAPNFLARYKVWPEVVEEPFGARARLVRGAVAFSARNVNYAIPDCVFYACIGLNGRGERTANFGSGIVSPWPQVPGFGEIKMPFLYDRQFKFVEINMAATKDVVSGTAAVRVNDASEITLHRSEPNGFTMFKILPGKPWMALKPSAVNLSDWKTGWPGDIEDPIAMIDTGGGPVFLSDPQNVFQNSHWNNNAKLPEWLTSASHDCHATAAPVSVEFSDGSQRFSYAIDTSAWPSSVRGLTLLACKSCEFMFGWPGMNIGGISALFNSILVDVDGQRVGFKAKT